MEGASENAATVRALLDDLVSRGLASTVPRLFIVDGAKALSNAIRRTFGFSRCDAEPKDHKASSRNACRNDIMRPPVGCCAWELDKPNKAKKSIRNLAHRLDQQCTGVAASMIEASTKS